jgi:hypothetical protein
VERITRDDCAVSPRPRAQDVNLALLEVDVDQVAVASSLAGESRLAADRRLGERTRRDHPRSAASGAAREEVRRRWRTF